VGTYAVTASISWWIEAESEEEAYDKAQAEALSNYGDNSMNWAWHEEVEKVK
jgi:hypothetical protein